MGHERRGREYGEEREWGRLQDGRVEYGKRGGSVQWGDRENTEVGTGEGGMEEEKGVNRKMQNGEEWESKKDNKDYPDLNITMWFIHQFLQGMPIRL